MAVPLSLDFKANQAANQSSCLQFQSKVKFVVSPFLLPVLSHAWPLNVVMSLSMNESLCISFVV